MYELIGMLGSPYSMKLRALLRYRRIQHIWTVLFPSLSTRHFSVRPLLVPILRYPDGSERIDSTPLCADLERKHPGVRSVYPPDPVARFASLLIEDFADEWLTKAMFHYRWNYAEDVDYCSRWLASDICPGGTPGQIDAIARALTERQVSRLAIVGCGSANVGVIEEGLRDLLDILTRVLESAPFLFGTRPSIADFALYGQLSQLTTDPVPARLIRQDAQIVYDWVRRMGDTSGVEGEWSPTAMNDPNIKALLALIARDYLPFLVANGAAVENGCSKVSLQIGGRLYEQRPFPYQLKCLKRLRELYASHTTDEQRTSFFSESGCDRALRV